MKCRRCPVASDTPCRGEEIPHKCGSRRYRDYFARRAAEGGGATITPDPRAEEIRAMARLPRLLIEAGCAEEIPEGERHGCGCVRRCLRGRAKQANGGVTLAECRECPERPEIDGSPESTRGDDHAGQ